MTDDAPPSDADMFVALSAQLVDAALEALPGWVVSSVRSRAGERFDELAADAGEAAQRCAAEIGIELRALLALDVDEQRTTPLAILRGAARYPTDVLARAGVPTPDRDEFSDSATPDDVYDLGPGTWADLGPRVAEAGIAWGAGKAHLHLRRHRPA